MIARESIPHSISLVENTAVKGTSKEEGVFGACLIKDID